MHVKSFSVDLPFTNFKWNESIQNHTVKVRITKLVLKICLFADWTNLDIDDCSQNAKLGQQLHRLGLHCHLECHF